MDDPGIGAPPPPPPPGAGGGSTFGPLGVGEVISKAFEVYQKNAVAFLQFAAIIIVPLTLVQSLLTKVAFKQATGGMTISNNGTITVNNGSSLGHSLLILAVSGIIGYIATYLLQGALSRLGVSHLAGSAETAGVSWKRTFDRLGALLGVAIVAGLIVGIGLILLVIPGIIAATGLAVAVPACIVEGKGVGDSLSRSWNLVKGHFWHTLGAIFLAGLIAAIVSGILGAIGGSGWFLSWIMTAIAQVITAPFVGLVGAVLYVDLRARSEMVTPEVLQRELSAT